MPVDPAQSRRHFVETIEKRHSRELRRFLAMRVRNAAADVPDLIQEIYLRVLRLKDHEAIRNPQAYLYTIASHVLHQHALRRADAPTTMDPLEIVSAMQSSFSPSIRFPALANPSLVPGVRVSRLPRRVGFCHRA